MRLGGVLRALRLALLVALAVVPGQSASADVREVASGKGIRAWLAEDHSSKLIALRFAFLGGSSAEAETKAGVTRLLARMLREGGGTDDGTAFRMRAERAGLRLGFQAGRDALYGNADILSAHRDESARLIRAALIEPRLPAEVLERVKAQVLDDLAEAGSDPRTIANDRWYARAFAGEAYARSPDGTPETVAAIRREDIAAWHAGLLTKSRLVVVAAGDITPSELARLLDEVMGDLPGGKPADAAKLSIRSGQTDGPDNTAYASAAIVFGAKAPRPGDAGYAAARVLAHVLGSGNLDSRLLAELRVRDGLVYSADASLLHDTRAALILGALTTANDKADAAWSGLRVSIDRLAREGASEAEVTSAKAALIGNSLLSIDSTASLADALLFARLDGEDTDFLAKRRVAFDVVATDDVRRAAKQLLSPEAVVSVRVGGAP